MTRILILTSLLLLPACSPLRAAVPHLFDAAEAAILEALDDGRARCGDAPCVQEPTDLDLRAAGRCSSTRSGRGSP